MNVRNRIVEHVVVRAGDLVPHPLNYRRHPPGQQRALAASYREVGFARSLLGYRLADGRIQLIDGHLRRDIEPNMQVTVEVLDVNDEEARKLLLTLDPLTELAEPDADVVKQLTELTQASTRELNDLWQSLAKTKPPKFDEPPQQPEQFLILIECPDEQEQVRLLERLQGEGLSCRALMS
jgi:ParB-like chromosome segregation protein Spo0J